MSAVPGDIDTDHQPPLMVPLGHFVVGLGLLVVGLIASIGVAVGWPAGALSLVHIHLLLVGWICLTIMGAMTQFVPVWSGVALYSRRLSRLQLWLVVVGLLGFAGSLVGGWLRAVPVFGAVMLVGFWVFVYNIGRTLGRCESHDITERHFGLALGFFVLVTTFGLLLAVDFVAPVFAPRGISRTAVVGSHATLAAFGAVVTTILGALYQLATMFTQTDLHGVDHHLRRLEAWGYPLGVVLLAGGRLVESVVVAQVGGLLVVGTLLGFGGIVARRLIETQVAWTPMLSRYAVAVVALVVWGVVSVPSWIADPLAPTTVFGAPGTVHLLVVGWIGFVVWGTLYHIVPFIVWVHRYSDRLGYKPVPMIDDLYDDRLAAADFWLLVVGTGMLVGSDLGVIPAAAAVVGGVVVLLGAVAFVANMGLVIHTHSPRSIGGVPVDLVWGGGRGGPPGGSTVGGDEPTDEVTARN